MSGHIRLHVEDAIARVTLSNPAKFNAMSRAMWRELRQVFNELQARCDVRVVVVAGE
ncbi:MAG: enoyl-CoA hydratase/isomerase family protein, partial [Hydrogenophaga sp.]|uniref:enoyl-CoA hydratase/isomerase family protein n=1 Tax=Hydrogenophaga sp. TaxID=1904254 RepID=UPI003D9ACA2F